jgi:hypothetical protein
MIPSFEDFEGIVTSQFVWLETQFGYSHVGCRVRTFGRYIAMYTNGGFHIEIYVDNIESITELTICKDINCNITTLDFICNKTMTNSLDVIYFCKFINPEFKFPKTYHENNLFYLVDISNDMFTYCKTIINGSFWISTSDVINLKKIIEEHR